MTAPTLLERLETEVATLERECHPGTPAEISRGHSARYAHRVVTTVRAYISELEAASWSSTEPARASALLDLFETLGK